MSLKPKKQIISFKKTTALLLVLSITLSLIINNYNFTNGEEIPTSSEITEVSTVDNTMISPIETVETTTDEAITIQESISNLTTETLANSPELIKRILKYLNQPRSGNLFITPGNENAFLIELEALELATEEQIRVEFNMANLSGKTIYLPDQIDLNPNITSLTFTNVNNITLVANEGSRHFSIMKDSSDSKYMANFPINFGGIVLSGNSNENTGGLKIGLTNSVTDSDYSPTIENVKIRECSNSNGNAIEVHDANLTLLPSVILEENENALALGGAVYVDGNSTDPTSYTLTTSAVIQNNLAEKGGGIYSKYNVINNGHIYNNTANDGGGVYSDIFSNNSSGIISHNTATNNGGGIYIYGNGKYGSLEGGISNNTATNDGGGAYFPNSQDINALPGIIIIENTALNGNGGGIYGKGFFASYPVIQNNHAPNGKGGGIYDRKDDDTCSITLFGGSVSYNTAKEGGGIYTETPVYFDIGDNASNATLISIKGNKAEIGGGMYIKTSSMGPVYGIQFDLGYAIIEDNIAQIGGGVYVEDLIFNGPGTIVTVGLTELDRDFTSETIGLVNNKANSGGGIYTSGKVFLQILKKATISDNEAVLDLADSGDFTIPNMTNTGLSGYGGGIYVDSKYDFSSNDTYTSSISTFDKDISASNPSDNISIKINSNKADRNGGAISVGYNAHLALIDGIMENNEAYLGGAIGLTPSTASINLDKFDNGNSKTDYTGHKFIFNGNKSTSEISLDDYLTTEDEAAEIIRKIKTKYPTINTELNYIDKYIAKSNSLVSDRFFTTTVDSSNQVFSYIFNNYDVQIGTGEITPEWEADPNYWYSEYELPMLYKDISSATILFNDDIDKILDDIADTNKPYKFENSDTFEGYVYGEESTGSYGLIRTLNPYKIDITSPTISNTVITPDETVISFKSTFADAHSGLKSVKIELLDETNKIVKTINTTSENVDETFTGLNPNTEYTITCTATDNSVNKHNVATGNVLIKTSKTKTLASTDTGSGGGGGGGGGDNIIETPAPTNTPTPVETVVPSEIPLETLTPTEMPIETVVPTETPVTTVVPSETAFDPTDNTNDLIIPTDTDYNGVDTSNIINTDGTITPITIEPSNFDDNIYFIFDENGTPLGFIELNPGESLNSIDIASRLKPLTDSVKYTKPNPKTGNVLVNNFYKYFILLSLIIGIRVFIKKRFN